MPPTGAETLQAAKERKNYGQYTRKDAICQMENNEQKWELFPMNVSITLPLEKAKMFIAADFDDFIDYLIGNHCYAVYRYFVERDEQLKGWIREGGMADDAF